MKIDCPISEEFFNATTARITSALVAFRDAPHASDMAAFEKTYANLRAEIHGLITMRKVCRQHLDLYEAYVAESKSTVQFLSETVSRAKAQATIDRIPANQTENLEDILFRLKENEIEYLTAIVTTQQIIIALSMLLRSYKEGIMNSPALGSALAMAQKLLHSKKESVNRPAFDWPEEISAGNR